MSDIWIFNHLLLSSPLLTVCMRMYDQIEHFNYINLQGAAIGNGVIDYMVQNPSYTTYAYMHGLIPLEAKHRIDLSWQRCLDKAQYKRNVKLNRGFFDDCGIMEQVGVPVPPPLPP